MNNYLLSNMLPRTLSVFIGLTLLFSLPLLAHAVDNKNSQTADPVTMLQIAIEDVLAELKTHEALYQSDPEQLRSIVAKSALPNINMTRVAQLALGKHWRNATVQQREIFVREFQRYLIRSYTNTLYLYRDSKLEILGNDDKANDTQANRATIKVRVKNDRGQNVLIFFRLEFYNENWKIVDINVEGVSLLTTIRGTFDGEINKIGLDSFLKNLTEENDKSAQNKNE
jgi:phospholipid transport system substrate-binding protein